MSNWPTELDIAFMAYERAGSSPCEDCDDARRCLDGEWRCNDRLNWDKEYNKYIEELTELYHGSK